MRRTRRTSAAFTLVEVMVALALLLVLIASVSTVLAGATAMTRDDKHRLQATDLASRELEIIRDTFGSPTRGPTEVATNQIVDPSPLPGGSVGHPLVIDNVPYTVTRTAQWAPANDTAASTCDDGTNAELAYLKVHVEVSWPGLGDRPPVVMDTVLTPPKGTYSDQSGNIGVKVLDSTGQPEAGRLVTVTGGPSAATNGFTSSDGCALFAFLTPGTYQVSVSQNGYVDQQNHNPATVSLTVQSGQMVHTTINYDQAATIAAAFMTASGYALPTSNNIPITLGNSALLPAGSNTITGAGNMRALTNLWPYPSGYEVWAGPCLDNDPESTGQSRAAPVATPPGGVAIAAVALGPVNVTGPSGTRVTASHSADSACPSGETITLGTTDGSGNLATSLPYGTWNLTAGSAAGTVTIVSGDPPQSVTLA